MINHLVFGPADKCLGEIFGIFFCFWQAVVQIVSAFDAARTRNLSFKVFDKLAGFLYQFDGTGFGDFVPGDEVETGTAAHRSDIEDVIRVGGVAHIGCKQVPLRYNKDKRKNPVFSRVSAFVVAYSIPFPTLIVSEKSVE